MTYKGAVKNNIIERDGPPPFADGTRVGVTVGSDAQLPKNSPEAWLELAGTLSEEEAGAILKVVQEQVRRVDWEMWDQQEA